MTRRPEAVSLAARGLLKNFTSTPTPFAGMPCACANEDPEMFFSEEAEVTAAAILVCEGCPVRELCAAWGTAHEAFGVFGGLTAEERAKIRGAMPVYDSTDFDRIQGEVKFITQASADQVAAHYGVDARSVVRWRATIRSDKAAS